MHVLVSFYEALSLLEKNKVIYIQEYSEDTDTYENGDYPIDCLEDFLEMNEDNFIKDNYKLFIIEKCEDCLYRQNFIQQLKELCTDCMELEEITNIISSIKKDCTC